MEQRALAPGEKTEAPDSFSLYSLVAIRTTSLDFATTGVGRLSFENWNFA
jgi:hypothetical protein